MEEANRKKKIRRRLLETSKYWVRPVLDECLKNGKRIWKEVRRGLEEGRVSGESLDPKRVF